MTATEPLGVQIGAREIYDELKAVGAKVDQVVNSHAAQDRAITDHETRIRTLERARWPLPTVTALLALAAVVIALIGLLTRGG
jgi:hypothetical protein